MSGINLDQSESNALTLSDLTDRSAYALARALGWFDIPIEDYLEGIDWSALASQKNVGRKTLNEISDFCRNLGIESPSQEECRLLGIRCGGKVHDSSKPTEKMQRAFDLRKAGLTWREVASEMGTSIQNARDKAFTAASRLGEPI